MLTVTNSSLSGNSAIYIGGGILNCLGTLTLINSTLSGNYAADGGGIFNRGKLTVTNSSLDDNSANYSGGGITNGGALTVINSTLSGNSAGSHGGSILNWGILTVANSTLHGNSSGNYGGGISNWGGTLILTNSTFSGNGTAFGGTIHNYAGDEYTQKGTVTLARSIITHSPTGGNCAGEIISFGDNISSDATCINDSRLNDSSNTDPLLEPAGLQDNGGPTLTIALQPNSPAIDGVRYSTCPPPETDQRGVLRPAGAHCDIGAVEMSADSAPLTVVLDIKPGSVKNHINPRSNEKTAVAILSTGPDSNAEPFDATSVDPRSVRFGPKGAKATHRKVKDVNHDGEADLILYFKNRATGIQCGDTSASLTGETVDGQTIQGSDSVKVVGLRCLDPEALAKLRRLLRFLISLHEDHGYGHDQGGATH